MPPLDGLFCEYKLRSICENDRYHPINLQVFYKGLIESANTHRTLFGPLICELMLQDWIGFEPNLHWQGKNWMEQADLVTRVATPRLID